MLRQVATLSGPQKLTRHLKKRGEYKERKTRAKKGGKNGGQTDFERLWRLWHKLYFTAHKRRVDVCNQTTLRPSFLPHSSNFFSFHGAQYLILKKRNGYFPRSVKSTNRPPCARFMCLILSSVELLCISMCPFLSYGGLSPDFQWKKTAKHRNQCFGSI